MIKFVDHEYLALYCLRCHEVQKIKFEDCLLYQENSSPECPNCKRDASKDGQSFMKFCKFYDRLRKTDEVKLSITAVSFIKKTDEPFLSVSFNCNKCKKQFDFNFAKIKKLSQAPESFRCPKCKQNSPPLSLVRSYFGSLRWVIELWEFGEPWKPLLQIEKRD